MITTLASGIQLEASDSRGITSVWLHVVITTLFFVFVIIHINLHFGWKNWLLKFSKLKSHVTRVLWWITVVTLISAVIAFIHWILTFTHSPIGGVHGKIGFLMIVFAVAHTIKRAAFFKH